MTNKDNLYDSETERTSEKTKRIVLELDAPRKCKPRWEFKNIEDLVDHIAESFEIEPQSPNSIRVSLCTKTPAKSPILRASRRLLFDDPVLNQITSPHGELLIGSQSINVLLAEGIADKNRISPPSGTGVSAFAEDQCYMDSRGFEICVSEDGRTIRYTLDRDFIEFHAWRAPVSLFHPYWKIGTRIKSSGLNFDAAQIDGREYLGYVNQTCGISSYYDASGLNGDNLEVTDIGFGGWPTPTPTRIQSLCRAQWNGERISGMVSAGSECFVVGPGNAFPDGWPDSWPPINDPPLPPDIIFQSDLRFSTYAFPKTKTLTVVSTFPDPITITVHDAETESPLPNPQLFVVGGEGVFSNEPGAITIPPNSAVQIPITFTVVRVGEGTTLGHVDISWPLGGVSIGRRVQLEGRIYMVTQS